jgi:hypothetical protein
MICGKMPMKGTLILTGCVAALSIVAVMLIHWMSG